MNNETESNTNAGQLGSQVCAVVVTRNRLQLLQECITSIHLQSLRPGAIVVVNNASEDGTQEWLASQPDLLVLNQSNEGSAGGFNRGVREAVTKGFEHLWLMDDDTICHPDALLRLLKSADFLKRNQRGWGFLCSNVLFSDGSPCLMNIGHVDMREGWSEFAQHGLVRVVRGSFVSLLVNAAVVKKVGLPISDMFIWGDDLEFTKRISDRAESYLVGRSIVEHRMQRNERVDLVAESGARIDRYAIAFRNGMFAARKEGAISATKYFLRALLVAARIVASMKPEKTRKLWVVMRGVATGLVFNPEVEMIAEQTGIIS